LVESYQNLVVQVSLTDLRNFLIAGGEMGEDCAVGVHFLGNVHRLPHCCMLLVMSISGESVVEGGFMDEHSHVLSVV
jgi:hypothetical protein